MSVSNLPGDAQLGVPPQGLSALGQVVLNDCNRRILETAGAACGGDASWRGRKRAEARDLLALSQIAPPGRLTIGWLDLREPLRALLFMSVPVPCWPDESHALKVEDHAVLGLTYPVEAVSQQLPGPAFIQILKPHDVWHANVAVQGQSLCLGTRLPAGIPCKELVLMTYGALSMQSVQIDEVDAAGVLNLKAARWWQQNTHHIPLSTTPFLCTQSR